MTIILGDLIKKNQEKVLKILRFYHQTWGLNMVGPSCNVDYVAHVYVLLFVGQVNRSNTKPGVRLGGASY